MGRFMRGTYNKYQSTLIIDTKEEIEEEKGEEESTNEEVKKDRQFTDQYNKKWETLYSYTDEEEWSTKPIWDLPLLLFEYKCKDRKIAKEIAAKIVSRFEQIDFEKDKASEGHPDNLQGKASDEQKDDSEPKQPLLQ